MDRNEYIKTRTVCLKKRSTAGQAIEACAVLKGVKGVIHVTPKNDHHLKLTYSLEFLTFELIEGLLKELGFRLDTSIPAYLRRYYYQYMEDNARESLTINDEEHQLTCCIDPNEAENPDQYWDQYR